VDTVIIKIYGPGRFKIERKDLFVPEISSRQFSELSPTEKESKRPYLRRFVLHPPKSGIYLPGVQVYETIVEAQKNLRYVMQLDFSVPKMVYRNSLQEVSETDRDFVFGKLRAALISVGIGIEIGSIAGARVSAVHFCKNVILPKTIRMRDVLAELEKVDINKTVDVDVKEHKNGGRVLNIYSGTVERVFYDKISDATRTKNKRQDKNRVDHERGIIDRFNLVGFEAFRYEYRIKKTQTVMRDVSKGLGREYGDVLFSDLFTLGLFKIMVFTSWRELIERPENRLALFHTASELQLLQHIVAQIQKQGTNAHSLNNVLAYYGIARGIADHGAKEFRNILSETWCKSHPERLNKKIEVVAELTSQIPYLNNIVFIDEAIEKFVPITLQSLHNLK